MEKPESILNSIIAKNQYEDLVSLNAAEIADKLFDALNDREQDVLVRRFGLHGKNRETLEGIGKEHGLTRERIRQIETSSIKKIKKHQDVESLAGKLRQVISHLLEEHGGILEKNYLFEILLALSDFQNISQDKDTYKNYLDFMVNKILNEHFDEVKSKNRFNHFLKLKYQEVDHLEEIAKELIDRIKELKQLLTTAELIELAKELEAYSKHEEKLRVPDNVDLREVLRQVVRDDADIIHQNRPVFSLIQAVSDLEQNKFGQWGHKQWRQIRPKTINDKIYLVLKEYGKPMYYGDIAKKISELKFDKKPVNTATTHNELILDDKYVLVGRGLYGLKEWGFKTGTVADVIENILKKAGEPLTKEQITDEVLKQRMVKKTTVNLALMNKDKFVKTDDGKFTLKD